MSQKFQTPPRWSPSSFSPPSFSTLPFNSGNKVGAGFGTGYCDAQCPHDVKYINGEPNSQVEMMMMVTMTRKHLQKDGFFERIGSQARRTPMRVSGILARAASNSTSGKPMRSQRWPLSLFCLHDDDHDLDDPHHHYYWSRSKVFTPHPCDTVGQQRCEGTPCGDNKSGERWFMMMIIDHYYDKIMMIMILMTMMMLI